MCFKVVSKPCQDPSCRMRSGSVLHEPLLTSCFMAAEPSQCLPEASKHIHISISCDSLRCPVFVTEPKRSNNSLCTQSYPRCSLCNMKISLNHLIWSLRRLMHVVPRVHCTTEIKVGLLNHTDLKNSSSSLTCLKNQANMVLLCKAFSGVSPC